MRRVALQEPWNCALLLLMAILLLLCPQGKGLFATQLIRKGETIFVERPLVAAQFLWNALYRYRGEHTPCLVLLGPAASAQRAARPPLVGVSGCEEERLSSLGNCP